MMTDDETFVPDPKVCERYAVTSMTLWRWDNDASTGFPAAYYLGGRKYRKLSELKAWEASRRDRRPQHHLSRTATHDR